MTNSYKRTIIQLPLEDVPLFEEYAKRYSLSLSSAIIMLAKKSIEYEEALKTLPSMIEVIKTEQALDIKRLKKKKSSSDFSNTSKTSKKALKSKKK